MSKKNKQRKNEPNKEQSVIIGISKPGKIAILCGIITVAAGFFVLSKTDPYGRNWASHLSPFLLIAGYAAIGIGILIPGKNSDSKDSAVRK